MTTRICMGVDDGHYGIKTYDDRGKSGFVLSRARAGRSQIVNAMGQDTGVYQFSTDDTDYSCGNIAKYEHVSPESFPTSPINRVLIHMALHNHDNGHYIRQVLKQGGEVEIEVCTGLPIGRYFKQGKKNSALIEEKMKYLSKAVSLINDQGSEVNIKIKPSVTPQTFSAWYDYIITEQRNTKRSSNQPEIIKHSDRMKEPVAFVDVGGGTTDVVVIDNMNFEYTGNPSLNVGSNNVRAALNELIAEKFDLEMPSIDMVDSAFTKQTVFVDGKDHDVTQLVTRAFKESAEQIMSHIQQHIGTKGREVSKLCFIGGSAAEFKHAIQGSYTNETWPADAQIINARGMYKYLRYIAK
jgi:hypothetical protein